MFSSKLRSWMEAVRPRKRQHRKEKQIRASDIKNGKTSPKIQSNIPSQSGRQSSQPPATSRYSVNNLSSPESAYSTGYSTDGTSPGAAPDYYINIRTGVRYYPTEAERFSQEQHSCSLQQDILKGKKSEISPRPKQPSPGVPLINVHHQQQEQRQKQQQQNEKKAQNPVPEMDGRLLQARPESTFPSGSNNTNGAAPAPRLMDILASPVLTSPRQRNRIRTNPWLPRTILSPNPIRQDTQKSVHPTPVTYSPLPRRFLSPATGRSAGTRNRSLSSSSCSSLSTNSVQSHWKARKNCSGSEEDDCTLNEMMGKYDESYVYEKETDILSDNDPTDCDTDIDTGQDGGDEDDPLEIEFDFIDNGSYLELDPNREDRNTGHCTYYSFDVNRKVSARRRTTRRSKQSSEKRRRSSSNKKRHKQTEKSMANMDGCGSKSAGATPLSVRRTNHHPVSKLALEDCLKKRSNSISFSRDPITTIDKRDKEADKKYKELIVEAENILQSMNTNGLSPRRIPGPANKRVEILRSTECAKPESFIKNRLTEEANPQFTSKIPSNHFSGSRFSPKKNHITNFIINNSPVLIRREAELPKFPLVGAKNPESPRNRRNDLSRRSPKYRKKINKSKPQQNCGTSSDSDNGSGMRKFRNASHAPREYSSFGCPQSEPVRRKVYAGGEKTVAFNPNYENICNNNSPPYSPTFFESQDYKNSSENIRQQVLLNTIANLKRSLEDQSASLKKVYKSSQSIHYI